MFVPLVPNTTIINKTIVYSDTVLPLKENGNNLIVTTIDKISDYSLHNCLKIIFESNPNVIFNTIQYSKQEKKLYIYSNEEISTKEYEENKCFKYKPITSKSEILEEIKNVLLSQKNKEEGCISLYDVAVLLKQLNFEYNSIIKKYKLEIDNALQSTFNTSSSIIIHDFDYKNKLLKLSFKKFRFDEYSEICFTKNDDDLYVVKSESGSTEEFFHLVSSKLSKLYDELIKYTEYKDYGNSSYNIKSRNSNFSVNINHYGTTIYVKNNENDFINEFEINSPSYTNGYKVKCNSSIINEVIQEKQEQIFKNIFVKIEDCPSWSREMLYQIRKKQLEKENKNQIKQEIIMRIKRTIFPFLNK